MMTDHSQINRDRSRPKCQAWTVLLPLILWSCCCGCTPLGGSLAKLPGEHQVQQRDLTVYSDIRLPKHHALVEELVNCRQYISHVLQLPQSTDPIHVYVFEDARELERFTRQNYPSLAGREAYFVKRQDVLQVLAYWHPQVDIDLRHEVTHGYLHSVLGSIPLWLDEGLAEFFEVAGTDHSINRPHVELLTHKYRELTWRPSLRQLEQLEDPLAMSRLEYAEAWLWTHYLLNTSETNRAMLLQYLQRLHAEPQTTPPLSNFLLLESPDANELLIEHLEKLTRQAALMRSQSSF